MAVKEGEYCPYCAKALDVEQDEDEYEKGIAACLGCERIFHFSIDDGLLTLEEVAYDSHSL